MSSTAVPAGGRSGLHRFASGFGLLAAVLSVAGLVLAVGLATVPALLHHGTPRDSGPSYLTLEPAVPVRISLGGTGAVAPVVSSSLPPADAVKQPPTDAPLVTWWDGSARPGAAHGQTILIGHSAGAAAALSKSSTLAKGDFVDVLTKQGTMRYRVTAVRVLDPTKFAQASLDLYKQDGGAGRLSMISAQDWDGVAYQKLVVVTGAPLGEPNGRAR